VLSIQANEKNFYARGELELDGNSEIPSDSSTSWKPSVEDFHAALTGNMDLAVLERAQFSLRQHLAYVFL